MVERTPDTLNTYNDMVIPESWERIGAASQLTLLDSEDDAENLATGQKRQLCQATLGDLRRIFREICAQAMRVRELIMADGLQGDSAIMARPLVDDNHSARAAATAALEDFFYHDGQDVKETSTYTGAIACSRETLGGITELNRRKGEFRLGMKRLRTLLGDKQACTEMVKVYAALVPETPVNISRKEAGVMVRQCINKRLNIRQLERSVPVVPICPDRIRWKHTIVPSTIRISREGLIEVLESRASSDFVARSDLATMASCSDPVYQWKKGESEDVRIGVYCPSAVKDESNDWGEKNLSFKGKMPVFYLTPRLAPYIKTPKPRKNQSKKAMKPVLVFNQEPLTRHERNGKTIRESFLLSLDVRRYTQYAG